MNKYKTTLNGRFAYIQHEEIDQRMLSDEGARFTQFADSQYARNGHSSSVQHHWSFYGLVCPLFGFGMHASDFYLVALSRQINQGPWGTSTSMWKVHVKYY